MHRRRGSRPGRRGRAAAGGAGRTSRSTRRSALDRRRLRAPRSGRRRSGCRPIGQSRPPEVNAVDPWRAPYSAGRISSVMPASRTTIGPPAPDVEDASDEVAGPGDEEPAGLDGQAGRPAVRRQRLEELAELLGEARRPGDRRADVEDREAAAQVERVEAGQRPAEQARRPPAPGAPRPARRRPRRAASRRGGGSPASAADPPARRRPRSPPQARRRRGRTCSSRRRPPARAGSRARRPG